MKQKFQIEMCELLAQHHTEKAEEASTEVESLLLRAEMDYNDTPQPTLLKISYKTMVIEKFIAKKPNKITREEVRVVPTTLQKITKTQKDNEDNDIFLVSFTLIYP